MVLAIAQCFFYSYRLYRAYQHLRLQNIQEIDPDNKRAKQIACVLDL